MGVGRLIDSPEASLRLQGFLHRSRTRFSGFLHVSSFSFGCCFFKIFVFWRNDCCCIWHHFRYFSLLHAKSCISIFVNIINSFCNILQCCAFCRCTCCATLHTQRTLQIEQMPCKPYLNRSRTKKLKSYTMYYAAALFYFSVTYSYFHPWLFLDSSIPKERWQLGLIT